jgi:hypothetical protein
MSIVALKRKTEVKYNNMSVNRTNGFSLNGGRRSQGYIGQTSLSRSLANTPMKGDVARGNGGCCGTYLNAAIVQSGVRCQNDASVIKKSVLSTKGMLANKFKYIKRPYPHSTTKPDATLNKNTQGEYIVSKVQDAIRGSKLISEGGSCASVPTDVAHANCENCVPITKDESVYTSTPQSRYIRELTRKCVLNDDFYVQKVTQHTPLPS